MGLTIQRRNSTKTRAIITLVALFALVAQPMYGLTAGQVANAALDGSISIKVSNATELLAAAANSEVGTIKLGANIVLAPSQRLIFSHGMERTVILDGKNYTLSASGNMAGWNANDENYVVQAYKSKVRIQSITITGSDAAILVNGAAVELSNVVNVSGNEFGGIEVSQGRGVHTPAILKGTSALDLVNSNESNAKPTVWIDSASTADATVNLPLVETTHIGIDQKQYYLDRANTGTVATNVTQGTTYSDVQAAIAAAAVNDTVRLDENVTLSNIGYPTIRIEKPITFDGNGKTITAPFVRGTSGGQNNTALAVVSSDVTVKNLTTASTYTSNPAHGIVVQGSSLITGVILKDIKTKDATAGVILNGSTVTIDGISTNGSLWYGVGADASAQVTVRGMNSHTEAIAIKNESAVTQGTIVNVDSNQYVEVRELSQAPDRIAYALATAAPSAVVTVDDDHSDGSVVSDDNAEGPAVVTGTASNDTPLKSHWFEIKAPDGQLYYKYIATPAPTVSFNLRTIDHLPLDSKGRAVAGMYKIRYVVTNVNNIRNDDLASAITSVVVDNTAPAVIAGAYDKNAKILSFTTGDDTDVVALKVGDDVVTPMMPRNGNTWVFDVAAYSTSGATYYYTATATDVAGNEISTDTVDTVTNLPVQMSFTIATLLLVDPTPAIDPVTEQPAVIPAASLFRNSFNTVGASSFVADSAEVLGAQDVRGIDTGILGASKDVAAITPSAQGWKFFGYAWYWWLLTIAAVVAIWWWIAAARRRNQEA